jgi:hypothetical protein
MPDYGTARADFPGGDAHQLYHSIKRLMALPPKTRLFMCRDYKAPGRDQHAWETTVGEQRATNVHVKEGVSEEEFVGMRTARDEKLAAPRLLLPLDPGQHRRAAPLLGGTEILGCLVKRLHFHRRGIRAWRLIELNTLPPQRCKLSSELEGTR